MRGGMALYSPADMSFVKSSLMERSSAPTSTPSGGSTNRKVLVMGCDISKLSRRNQFVVCVGGVFGFYLMYGYCQELIFNIKGFKPYGWYLTFVQFIYYTLLATFESYIVLKDTSRRIPLGTYAMLSLLTVGTMGMSNASLGYLNYPTQVIFKSCKLIPVMIGGMLIQGKRYGLVDFISCLFMSVGLTFFVLAGSTLQPSYSSIGILMMTAALCADAAIGNVQEKALRLYEGSNTEMVLYSYGMGVVWLFIVLCCQGMLVEGFLYFAEHPVQKYGYTFLWSVTGYLGISFVLSLVQTFGALLTATVTTCRKGVTIILSFLVFAKPFTSQYVWSGLLVLLGILINVYKKNSALVDVTLMRYFQVAYDFCRGRKRRRQLHNV